MKKEITIEYDNDPILKSYTHHAFINAISNYYFGNSERVCFSLENSNSYLSYSENARYDQEGDKIVVYKNNVTAERSSCYLYKEANLEDKIEVELIKYKFAEPYANINLFLSYEKDKQEFNKDDNLIKIGLFNRGEIFIKVNQEFVYSKLINVKDIKTLAMKRIKEKIYFSCKLKNNKEISLYQLNLNPIYMLQKTIIGVNIDTNPEYFYNNIYMNYVQLYTKYDSEKNIMIDYYARLQKDYDNFTHDDYVFIQRYSLQEVFELFKMGLKQFVYEFIHMSRYVILFVDAYYVERSNWYGKEHRQLEVMFFSVVKGSRFNLIYVDNSQIVEGSILWQTLNRAICGERVVTAEFKPSLDIKKVSVDSLIMQLEDFVKSENSSKKNFNVTGVVEGKYGLSIYDEIIKKEDNLIEFSQNPRLSYILQEHTQLMKKRIDYLYDNKIIDCKYDSVLDEMLSDMQEIQADIIAKKALTYVMRKSIAILLKRKKQEEKLYSEIILRLQICRKGK